MSAYTSPHFSISYWQLFTLYRLKDITMIPPKKSKAARENAEEEPAKNGETQDAASDEEGAGPAKKPRKEVNIFTEPLVEGKRARTIPVSEVLLNDW